MATITLVANTDYSSLTVADNDTIDLAGFALNFDVVPTQTGVSVGSPGTPGSVTLGTPNNYPLVGWEFTAGTGVLIDEIAAVKTFGGKVFGGEADGANGVRINRGTIDNALVGGSAINAHGVQTNYGIITGGAIGGSSTGGSANSSACGVYSSVSGSEIRGDLVGGSGEYCHGIYLASSITTGNIYGGTGPNSTGIYACESDLTGTITGGSGANSDGVMYLRSIAYGLVTAGVSGTGVRQCLAACVGGTLDVNSIKAVGTYRGSATLVHGPLTQSVFNSNVKTIYSLFGPLHPDAAIATGTEVIVLSGDVAAAVHRGNRLAQRGVIL